MKLKPRHSEIQGGGFAERRQGQVPLYIYNDARHDVSGL